MGGILPLSFGLFHQQEPVRHLTVEIFNELRQYPVSGGVPCLGIVFAFLLVQRTPSIPASVGVSALTQSTLFFIR
jgi:hypothetical protein